MTVVMRTHGDPLALVKPVAAEVHSLDKHVPIAHFESMDQVVADKLWRGRLVMMLLGLFAAVAATLAVLGLYGAISYSVSQRSTEIWIRMAIGAMRADVLRMVLLEGMKVVGLGVAAGLIGSWVLSRTLAGMLYGVTATDPLTFLVVPLLLLATGAAACSIPALRKIQKA
jgi:ABC-type antimicrobial peptide transport system permease subunit